MDKKNYLQYIEDTYGFAPDWYWSAFGLPSRLRKNLQYFGYWYPRIIDDDELNNSLTVDIFKFRSP